YARRYALRLTPAMLVAASARSWASRWQAIAPILLRPLKGEGRRSQYCGRTDNPKHTELFHDRFSILIIALYATCGICALPIILVGHVGPCRTDTDRFGCYPSRVADTVRPRGCTREWLNPPDLVRAEREVIPGYPDRAVPKDTQAAANLRERTLTNLYNNRPQWLTDLHRDLDVAVAAAYGWPADISDED